MTDAETDVKRFTPDQLHAIEHREGELLLDAGAGSGKTLVLVERFARAVEEDGVGVNQILTITFTDKAAAELRERIRARLRAGGDDEAARATEGAWISTIHAFCARLLRTHALDAGLDPEFSVIEEPEGAQLRRVAADAAIAGCASTEDGAELIANLGIGPLRTTVAATYDELRARGALEPELPSAPPAPTAADVRAAARAVIESARALQRELGEIPDPGHGVLRALERLELVGPVLARLEGADAEPEPPWPGELDGLRLGKGGGAALKTEACERYGAALDDLGELAGRVFATAARDGLDALLREYGARYTALKRERSVLDFTDLELLARELLRRPEIGERYRERFKRVMVDEMQDTNSVQFELIDLVAGSGLFMVGDAQQSIYGFRHADVELFEQRGARLAQTGGRASLKANFRTHPAILSALNVAFADSLGESFRALEAGRGDELAAEPLVELIVVDKDAVPAVQTDPHVEHLAAPWRVAEARALAARVRALIDAGQARAGDVVLLLRATTDMNVYEQALEQAGLPTYLIGGRGYWAQQQVIELIAYLRALVNPLDTDALHSVLRSPLCGISVDGLVLVAAGAAAELADSDRERLESFAAWFAAERRAAAWLGPEQLLDRALAHSGYELQLAGLSGARRRLANVRKLMRLARDWQAAHGSDLHGFTDLLQSRVAGGDGARESEAPVESEALDAVRLMTIHRSKGLEFPVVCVADLGRQVVSRAGALVTIGRDGGSLGLRLKHAGHGGQLNALAYDQVKAEEHERELAEERRLFYVAMTRAQERLIVSGAGRFAVDWEQSNQAAPIGWVAPAFVPGIGTKASAASAASFVTELGVRVSFVTDGGAVDVNRLYVDKRRQPPTVPAPLPLPAADDRPAIASLSYTALATYERCGYRFYVQRVLGLPDAPAAAAPAGASRVASVAPPALSAAARGTLIHELLARVDLRRPSLREPLLREPPPDDVNALLSELFRSPIFTRLQSLRDVRREQRFAFPVSGTLITGIFDVIAREGRDGRLLVVDYKSDRLDGGDPEAIVAARYGAQRTIYALAALKLGAPEAEVLHLFLEAPENPATARFTAADMPALEADLAQRVAGPLTGDFPVTDAPGRRVCDGCPAQGGLCSYPLELTSR